MQQKNFDKPNIMNTACLLNPVSTPADKEAENMRKKVLNAESEKVKVLGKIWYISQNGDDGNDGLSVEKAFKTPDALTVNADKISFGDAVLFERGGVYRGAVTAKSGVYYGAYGKGDKPCLYISCMNYANALWEKENGDIWKTVLPKCSYDLGIMVFNHGEAVGIKKHTLADVKTENDFYYEDKTVYLLMKENPSDRYKSIEMGDLTHGFFINVDTTDVTIDNLTIKYSGGMAIQAVNGAKNIKITNCEIGWCGGCYLPNYGNGKVRFGNGIEFWNGCDGVNISNCWIYQIYDSGFSHQGNGTFVEKNISFCGNLIEYTSFASIEYWTHDANKNSMQNILYENNILRFAGLGWGDIERPDIHAYHVLSTGKMDHKCENFVIKNNIFDLSKRGLIRCTSKVGTLPEITGNTYIQTADGLLGAYGDCESENYAFSKAEDVIKEVFGDTSAKVITAI